jgi:hypothetical protein
VPAQIDRFELFGRDRAKRSRVRLDGPLIQ